MARPKQFQSVPSSCRTAGLILAVVFLASSILGDEPTFRRAEIWYGTKRVYPPATTQPSAGFSEIYIDGKKVRGSEPVTVTNQPSAIPDSLDARPAPPARRGPLVLEFPLPRKPVQPRTSAADIHRPVTGEMPTGVNRGTPIPTDLSNLPVSRDSSQTVAPAAVLPASNHEVLPVLLTLEKNKADSTSVNGRPAGLTESQQSKISKARSFLPAPARLIFSVADPPQPQLSAHVFFWPLVLGLLFLFFVRRESIKRRSRQAD
ncbi:MAG: hypothetical protein VB876_09150 [Pirellulales bacterium]